MRATTGRMGARMYRMLERKVFILKRVPVVVDGARAGTVALDKVTTLNHKIFYHARERSSLGANRLIVLAILSYRQL